MRVPKVAVKLDELAKELGLTVTRWIGDTPMKPDATPEEIDAARDDLITQLYGAHNHAGTLGGIDEQVTALLEEIKPLHVLVDSVKKALAKKWLDIDENGQPFTTRPSVPEPSPETKPIAYPVIHELSIVCYCGTRNDFPPDRNWLLVCSCCRAPLVLGDDIAPGCRRA